MANRRRLPVFDLPVFNACHAPMHELIAAAVVLLLCLSPLANAGTTFRNVSPMRSSLYAAGDAHGASGGRFNKLAAVHGSNQVFYAASEWGGLWKTIDGGKNWFPLVGHVPQVTWDVAVDPAQTQIVYATSLYDGRADPRSGIQVSYDSGSTWTRPATVTPPAALNCPWQDQLSGFGIAIEPGAPNKVYVGTNCGIAMSTDSGATWSYVDPDPANAGGEIWDVVAQAGGLVDACGLEGHFRSGNSGGNWNQHALPFPTYTTRRCSLAVSPDEPDVIFVADDINDTGLTANFHSVWESDNGGQSWTNLPKARGGDPKRLPFVTTNKRSDLAGQKRFDLWYGEQDIWRTTCLTPANPIGAGNRCFNPAGSWNIAGPGPMLENGGAHGDSGDLAFDATVTVDACPEIYSSDGGIYYRNPASPCDDPTFLQPDVSPHALWLWGMAGFNNAGNVNLYFGLQDDGMWATLDARADPPVWSDRLPSDSFGVVADASRVVWFGNDDLHVLYVQAPGMAGPITQVTLPAGQLMRAFIFLPAIDQFGDKKYVIATRDANWVTSVFVTQDITASPVTWTALGTAPVGTCGIKASVSPAPPGQPVFYVQAGANCNAAFHDNEGDGLYVWIPSTSTWQQIAPAGGIGIFDVDPNNPNRLYASSLDPNGRHMVFSTDGGSTWHADAGLDARMTGNGVFNYSNTRGPTNDYGFSATFIGYPQPSLVAFDPYDANIIVAGGRDSGLFLSTDGGANWGLVSDPFQPTASRPHISRPWFAHFYHDPAGGTWVYIGTQGQGVWEVAVRPPTADAGGPYTTNEGANIQLAGTGSDPDGSALSYAWDLDNNGFFETLGQNPTFSNVGQDGVFTVRLKVTAGGVSTIATTTVTVNNVAPTVTLSSDAPQNENATITVSGSVTDPGWQDPLSATIEWGDGSAAQPISGTVEHQRPDASLSFSLTHVYGDNGSFTAKVCAHDDDASTCQTILLQVNNVAPTAVIDKSSAILINGVPTILTHAGQSQSFSGSSTDPGSDDLKLTWQWGDGTANSVTDSLVNPPNPDPPLSPSIQPRNVTDAPAHTFNNACLYEVTFVVTDDDSGSGQDTIKVVIVGNALAVRSAGYWQTQFGKALGAPGKADISTATLSCDLQIAAYMSQVFNEARNASTLALAWGVLNVAQNSGSATEQLDRQLLAVWLNFANGAIALSQPLDTNGDGIADTTLALALANAEAVRLNPLSTAAQLRAQKNLLERINLGP